MYNRPIVTKTVRTPIVSNTADGLVKAVGPKGSAIAIADPKTSKGALYIGNLDPTAYTVLGYIEDGYYA